MNLYKISQEVNIDYDTYDSAVVAAETEEEAKRIIPGGYYVWGDDDKPYFVYHNKTQRQEKTISCWCPHPDYVSVEYIGKAKDGLPKGEVVSSFNAG